MDAMDYEMHNGPEPSTPRSHQSGPPPRECLMASSTLPHPHPHPNVGLSTGRPYDPVHSTASWGLPQPNPSYPWTHPSMQTQYPPHQPRIPAGEQAFYAGNGGMGGGLPAMSQGFMHGQAMHDPFGPPSWAYPMRHSHTQNPQRLDRLVDNNQRFGGAPPMQIGHNSLAHQTNNYDSGRVMASAAPRSLPTSSLQLPQSQPTTPPQNISNSLDSSPSSSSGRVSFGDSPSRTPPRSNLTMSHAPSSTAPPPDNQPLTTVTPALQPYNNSSNSNVRHSPFPMSTPPAPPNPDARQTANPPRSQPPPREILQESDGGDSEDEYDMDGERLRMMESFQSGPAPYPRGMGDMTESHIRAHQILRGAVSNRRIASKSAISSLLSVEIDSLPENERMCIICYNDFGTPTPEGINEAPLRLPKCKHVFGDHCIKKWFEESDSCPYCRDKVPSEPQYRASQQAVHQFLASQQHRIHRASRNSGGPSSGPPSSGTISAFGNPESMVMMFARRNETVPPPIPRGAQPGGRRSPPEERGESSYRRMRPRVGSFRGSPPSGVASGSNSNPRPNSFAGPSSLTASQYSGTSSSGSAHQSPQQQQQQQQSLVRDRFPNQNFPWQQMPPHYVASRQRLTGISPRQFSSNRPHAFTPGNPGQQANQMPTPPYPLPSIHQHGGPPEPHQMGGQAGMWSGPVPPAMNMEQPMPQYLNPLSSMGMPSEQNAMPHPVQSHGATYSQQLPPMGSTPGMQGGYTALANANSVPVAHGDQPWSQ